MRDLLGVLLADGAPHGGVLQQGVPGPHPLRLPHEQLHEPVVEAALHEHTCPVRAHLGGKDVDEG